MFSATTKENANNLKSDLRETAASAKRDTDKVLNGSYSEQAEAFAHEAGRKARDCLDSVNEHLSDTARTVHSEIKDNPLRSTLIALGAGFVLGALFRR
jgi:ElaB/YqjD/DUF883 family membrane-anchored ribosome-binding protein